MKAAQKLQCVKYQYCNKSGEELSQGDSVQIWYFTDLNAGFIGLRCGTDRTLEKLSELESRIKALEEKS